MTEETTLDMLQPGDETEVCSVALDPAISERFMEMGIIAGTRLKVCKFAPLGDPIEVLLRGYHFSLRRREAAGITVKLALPTASRH